MIYTLHITQKGFNVKLNTNKKFDTSFCLSLFLLFLKETNLGVLVNSEMEGKLLQFFTYFKTRLA